MNEQRVRLLDGRVNESAFTVADENSDDDSLPHRPPSAPRAAAEEAPPKPVQLDLNSAS